VLNRPLALFARGIPRPVALLAAVVTFAAVPPEAFARGPALCLWRFVFQVAACPACGSTRALAAFFHGRFTEALAFNRNVIVTAPLILALLGSDLLRSVGNARRGWLSRSAGVRYTVDSRM
jgi:hypothetical protein